MESGTWCQNDIMLPSDLEPDDISTVYWAWDWPTAKQVRPNVSASVDEAIRLKSGDCVVFGFHVKALPSLAEGPQLLCISPA
jgi:hypothetical protein